MSDLQLLNGQIRKGVWYGQLAGGSGVPQVDVLYRDAPVSGVSISESDGGWSIQVSLPPEAISEGVQTFTIIDKMTGNTLGDFTLIAGEALGDDIRAEVELLRAELDMLKRAFRRHCVETT